MLGKYEIEVYNNRVHYFLTVKRNITILQGNSATGKTELIRLIGEYEENGASSGITLKCQARCTVLTPVDWKLRLGTLHESIIFIDETAGFIRTREFARMIRNSDNYFVMITRDDLEELPYSVEEIYGLRNSGSTGKYRQFRKVYNEMYQIYHLNAGIPMTPEKVITEDSGSGYQYFERIYKDRCVSAGGKSNVYACLRRMNENQVLAAVDGAAFGSEIGRIMRWLQISGKKYVLYAPESFEYLILKSGILQVPAEILEKTYLHADSCRYFSWEEFYTSYLIHLTQNTVYQYSKSVLNEAYLTDGGIRKIAAVLPEQIRPGK